MGRKILKTILAVLLIITLAMVDVIFLGYNVVTAISTTNVENVEFDAYFNEEVMPIQKENTLTLKIAVKESGLLKDTKIKIENANFKLTETQNQYIKKVDVLKNEIELNQLIAGNQVQIDIPVIFARTEEITKEYLSKQAKIKLTGSYRDGEYFDKTVQAERKINTNWTEEQKIAVEQGIDKWVDLGENKTLLEQKIETLVINNVLVKEKQLEVTVPEIRKYFT